MAKTEIGERIKAAIIKTKLKRSIQRCSVVKLKIDFNRLSKQNQIRLKMFFVEAKWLYNYVLSQKDPFHYDYKTNPIQKMNKNRQLETVELKYLPAKCKQDLVFQLLQNIKTLSSKKKKLQKVGMLRFKSEINSISLSQYDVTHRIENKKIKIVGIKSLVYIYGLHQIKSKHEFANAKLIRKPSGYYIHLTCYEYIKPEQIPIHSKKEVGLDFGIKTSITTSEGEKFKVSIDEPECLKRLQRQMMRQIKGSNNRYKTRWKIRREYELMFNKKKDVANKLVHYLLTTYERVYMQDENLNGWQKHLFGKQVQHSYLGLVKYKLTRSNQTTIIERYFPSTKMCYQCGKENILKLSDRIYKCDCGLEEDRDVKAAKTILHIGKSRTNYIPVVSRELTPTDLNMGSEVEVGSSE